MTTNQMVKLFAKVLKNAPPVELSEQTKQQIKSICNEIKEQSK